MVFCPPKTNTFEPQHSDSQGVSLGSFALEKWFINKHQVIGAI
jgi:hypothetical protein